MGFWKVLAWTELTVFSLLLAGAGYVHLFDPVYGGLYSTGSAQDLEEGERLYQAKQCASCHGRHGRSPPVETYPHINGQPEDYLFTQIKDIQSGRRSNGQSGIMRNAVEDLKDEDIRKIAKYLADQ